MNKQTVGKYLHSGLNHRSVQLDCKRKRWALRIIHKLKNCFSSQLIKIFELIEMAKNNLKMDENRPKFVNIADGSAGFNSVFNFDSSALLPYLSTNSTQFSHGYSVISFHINLNGCIEYFRTVSYRF